MPDMAIGKKAPDFTIPLDSGELFKLSAQKGSPVVLYFYPEDDTEGCTIENIEFSTLIPEFEKLDAKVVGISPDTVASHCDFRDKYKLRVPLGADPQLKVLKAYGVWGPKVTFGHHIIGVHRTSVLVGVDGKIAGIFKATRIKGHAGKVLDATRMLVGTKGR